MIISLIITIACAILFLILFIYARTQAKKAKLGWTNNLKEVKTELQKTSEALIQKKKEYDEQHLQLLVRADHDATEIRHLIKTSVETASAQYCSAIEEAYNLKEKEYDLYVQNINAQKKELDNLLNLENAKLEDLRATLSAGAQAQLREKEKEEKINFYKITIADTDLSDIRVLNEMKSMLHNPVTVSKIIWNTYFQKQTTELCNRIVGPQKKCGIYKITDLNTQQCYIGQSIDITNRWKEHIKCGLGIDAPSNNKLYQAMQKDGIWNFTFEVMEECERSKLDEREAFWIEMYQSNIFGLNTTFGNRGKS